MELAGWISGWVSRYRLWLPSLSSGTEFFISALVRIVWPMPDTSMRTHLMVEEYVLPRQTLGSDTELSVDALLIGARGEDVER